MFVLARNAVAGATVALLTTTAFGALAQDTIQVGMVGTASTQQWPLFIGMEKGMFDEVGVTIDLVSVASNASLEQQLAAGSFNLVVSSGIVDPIRAIDQGAPIAILRIDVQTPPYSLLAREEIESITDLEGGTIIVGGPADITMTYLRRMMEPNGLIENEDYDLVYAGSSSARFAAVQSGGVDAAILFTPYNFIAENIGLNNVGNVVDYAPELPFSVTATNRNWAADNGDALVRYLEAYVEAVTWFYDAGNRDEAITIMTDVSGGNAEEIEQAYDFLYGIDIFEPNGTTSATQLEAILQMLKADEEIDQALEIPDLILDGVTTLVD